MLVYYHTFYTDGSHRGHTQTRLEGAWAYSKETKVWGLPWRKTPLEVTTDCSGAMVTPSIFFPELVAIYKALTSVPEGSKGILFSDAKSLLSNLRNLNDYKGGDIDKKVLYNKVKKAYKLRRIQLKWIRGHSGLERHDRVDKLAKDVSKSIRCRHLKLT